jgi:hypothetical protein
MKKFVCILLLLFIFGCNETEDTNEIETIHGNVSINGTVVYNASIDLRAVEIYLIDAEDGIIISYMNVDGEIFLSHKLNNYKIEDND